MAREAWEEQRLQRAAGGDWECLKAVRRNPNVGWDVEFAISQQGDPHDNIHRHFQDVYSSSRVAEPVRQYQGDVEAFALEKL